MQTETFAKHRQNAEYRRDIYPKAMNIDNNLGRESLKPHI